MCFDACQALLAKQHIHALHLHIRVILIKSWMWNMTRQLTLVVEGGCTSQVVYSILNPSEAFNICPHVSRCITEESMLVSSRYILGE